MAQALLDAGAVLLGRLNLDEGAMSALGITRTMAAATIHGQLVLRQEGPVQDRELRWQPGLR